MCVREGGGGGGVYVCERGGGVRERGGGVCMCVREEGG